MPKVTPTTIAGQYGSTTELNDNFTLLADAIENTVSRDGTSPNTMSADLDMNSNDINNVDVVNANSVIIAGTSVVPGDTLTVPGASSVPNTPAGNIASTDVQDALNELDTEKVAIAGAETVTGDKTFSGTTVLADMSLTKSLQQKVGSDAASASALVLGDGNFFDVTGTTAITSITTKGMGSFVTLQFDAVLTLTYHATDLVLPGAGNIITTAGDIAQFYEYATGDWRCVSYLENSGAAVSSVGYVQAYPISTVPSGFLECDGAAISRTTYSSLFTYLGTNYGIGDGSTTFNIPDLRGEFLRGWDHGAGNDPDAASRTDRGDTTTGDNVGTKQTYGIESHYHTTLVNISSADGLSGVDGGSGAIDAAVNIDSNSKGGNETRPRNVYAMYCIKY